MTDEQKAKLNQKIANSTTPSPFELKPIFEAESPDELALIDAAYNYGCRLIKRTPTFVTVETPEEGKLHFDILHVLPFDSTRKRMSVIVKHPITKQIILYCKGNFIMSFDYELINFFYPFILMNRILFLVFRSFLIPPRRKQNSFRKLHSIR